MKFVFRRLKIRFIFEINKKWEVSFAKLPRRKCGNYGLLNYRNVHGLFAFGTGADLELDVLAFVERLETIR